MSTSPLGIYEPGIIDPGVPVKTPTESFWLSEPSPIHNLQSPWPESADVVIIGTGMTSVSLCRALRAKQPGLAIVVIDARGLCSGATGRNGGHIKAMSPGVWFERKAQFGVDEALRIMEYEHSHIDHVAACVAETNIQCDLRRVEGLDVYHDASIFAHAVAALEDLRKHSPALAQKYTIYTSREALEKKNCGENVVGAIGMPAGTMWPYKLVSGLFEKMVEGDNGVNVQTNTLVTSVTDSDADDYATVHTSRGDIRGRFVVHATNCWIGHLVPELRAFVSPVRANVQRQVPRDFTGLPAAVPWTTATNSFWLRYAEHDYDYLIQRPDGAFIVGRANTGRRATSDDGTRDLHAHAHLRGATPLLFRYRSPRLDTTHAWSGAVAFTLDEMPFVGQLPFPGRKHQWVSAAYQGIGMVRAFRTAQLLALLLLGEPVPGEYPKSMLLTEPRLKKFADEVNRAQVAKL